MTPLSMAERARLSDLAIIVAPPPTPSINNETSTPTTTSDVFSTLIRRLPPSLTLTPRAPPSITSSILPSLTLTDPTSLLSISALGFFQIPDSHIPPNIPLSAENEAISLFSLSQNQRNSFFPKNWPFGWDDDEEYDTTTVESICLDPTSSTSDFPLPYLIKFSQHLESLGLEVVQKLARALQFQNPFSGGEKKPCIITWVSDGSAVTDPLSSTRFYPYIVALQYQLRSQKFTLMADSGWVSVLPDVDSVLITLGDIAEVWSNGRVKKVRGKPVVGVQEEGGGCRSVVMTVLLSLPLDGVVRPLPFAGGEETKQEYEEGIGGAVEEEEEWRFKPFSMEEYGWRVYHERIHSKDPLNRYRM